MEGEFLLVGKTIFSLMTHFLYLTNDWLLLQHHAGFKIINDSVHGHMEFHPICMKVIDTPEFQRLRNIKQLGLTHLVYPSAAHSRFEHSLGVCHLAGRMIDELKKNNPSVDITDVEKLCVQLAGLCHDLGHGPFSHLWEHFLKRSEKEWKLEEQSIKTFEHLLEKNDLHDDFERCGLGKREIQFIKDLILGEGEPINGKKQFLFQVVNNKINHIDVELWDEYLRDGLHLNLDLPIDDNRLMRMLKLIRIMKVEDEGNKEVLVFKAKEAYSIYEMFNVGGKIHFAAAQHKVVLVLGRMLIDALRAADDHFLPGSRKLSQAHKDLDTWTKLTDNILFDILYSASNPLAPSRGILYNLVRRRLYQFITFEEVSSVPVNDPDSLTKHLENDLAKLFPAFGLVVSYCWFHFDSMGEDPFARVYFYEKINPSQIVKKRWNEVELFRSAEDNDPKPHCKIYIFSKKLNINEDDANIIKSDFKKILEKGLSPY